MKATNERSETDFLVYTCVINLKMSTGKFSLFTLDFAVEPFELCHSSSLLDINSVMNIPQITKFFIFVRNIHAFLRYSCAKHQIFIKVTIIIIDIPHL